MRFFAGFGHPALVAICALMVVGHALVVTGALEPAARLLAGWVASAPALALLAVLLGAGLGQRPGQRHAGGGAADPADPGRGGARQDVGRGTMLLPMNYAVLIGGMATTIGTSTNLIVVALAAGLGVGPFALFSFYPLVALAAVPALAYLWLVAPRLLAHVQPPAEEIVGDRSSTPSCMSSPTAGSTAATLREAFSATGNRLQLLELRRDERSAGAAAVGEAARRRPPGAAGHGAPT